MRLITLLLLVVLLQPAPNPWRLEPLFESPNDSFDPQWSPDGRHIAFVGHHEGNPDVYLLELSDDSVTNISQHSADDYEPMWSPDGRYLAFLHREKAYSRVPTQPRVYDMETGSVQDAFETFAEINVLGWRGEKLLFTEGKRVWVFDAAAGEGRMVYENFEWLVAVYVSPDGQRLLIQHPSPAKTRLVDITSGAIEIMPFSLQYSAAWSPDGKMITFQTQVDDYRSNLNLFDLDKRIMVTLIEVDHAVIHNLQWSADGRLAWTVSTSQRLEQPPYVLYDTGMYVLENGTTRELLRIDHFVEYLRWSPTRNQIAFETYAGLYVADVQTGAFSELAQGLGKLQPPFWSPDGNFIAALTGPRPDRYNYVMAVANVQTGALFVYDSGKFPTAPRWHPTEHRIVFTEGVYNEPQRVLSLRLDEG